MSRGAASAHPPTMTTTSYAILGLLAVKPWTTHELVQQVDRSLRRFWPRAQSKLYEEPKKLVSHGYARADDDSVGRRRRTRYTITQKGRRALAVWLQEPGAGPVLEFEQLLKISFADNGSKADILMSLEATRAWVISQNEENLATARAYLEGEGAFPQRAALNQLAGRFLTDFYVTVARWAEWASEIVDTWPDDVTRAHFNVAAAEEGVRLAESITSLSQSGEAGGGRGRGDRNDVATFIDLHEPTFISPGHRRHDAAGRHV
jgi:PadR family transcriptional regulator, regulatory protein AphA